MVPGETAPEMGQCEGDKSEALRALPSQGDEGLKLTSNGPRNKNKEEAGRHGVNLGGTVCGEKADDQGY